MSTTCKSFIIREILTLHHAAMSGMKLDLFVKDLTSKPYLGQVWPGPVHFPDFFHPEAQDYWTENLQKFYNAAPYDGTSARIHVFP
jgi:alpha-glucosidase (family GH31 glycosyl hydrolase)